MQALDKVFKLGIKEATLEMNPDDVTPQYLADLKNAGITRASMGVQSFDEQLLSFMHRAHTRTEAITSLESLASAGFSSFSVDLIYGNPGQSPEGLALDLETLIQYHPPHVSAYSLTIEPRTRLGKQLELGRLIPAEDDHVAHQFDMVAETLEKHGILRYEVSNFARSGHKALHNSAYWTHQNYLGFGPAAHSFWWDDIASTARRWSNKANLQAYLQGAWNYPFNEEILHLPVLAEERILLGLRTTEGVSKIELEKRYAFRFSEKQEEYLRKKTAERKIETEGNYIRLTPLGLKIADAIVLDLLSC